MKNTSIGKFAIGAALALCFGASAQAATVISDGVDSVLDVNDDWNVIGSFPFEGPGTLTTEFTLETAANVGGALFEFEPISAFGTDGFVAFQNLDSVRIWVNGSEIPSSPFTNGSDPLALFDFYVALTPGFVNAITIAATTSADIGGYSFDVVAPVPIPAAGVLFITGLLGAGLWRRRKIQQEVGLPTSA